MAVRKPIVAKDGKLQQISNSDLLFPAKESQTLAYSGGKLISITTANSVKTFSYDVNDKLVKIEDTANYETGRCEFFYTGDDLTSIVCGPWGLGLDPGDFGPEFWFDAAEGTYTDAGVTLATDGQSVQQWNDKSGNGHHLKQTTASEQPSLQVNIVNGRPVMRGDGTEWMVTDAAPLGGKMSFFMVLIPRATVGNTHRFAGQWPTATNWVLDGLGTQQANMLYGFQNSGATGTVSNNVAHILAGFKDSGCWARLNGVATTESPAVADEAKTDPFSMWADKNGNDVKQFDIAEAIGYDKILTATQIDDVESFLAAKYGITL